MKNIFKGKDNILRKGLASTGIKVLGALSSYVLSFLIAKKFGAEGNGVFALFMTYTVILSTFFYLGLDIFLVKQISILMNQKNYLEIKKLYNKILHNYIFPVLVILIIVGISLYSYFDKTIVLMVGCGVILNVFIDINSAVFRGMKMAEWYSFFIQFSKHFTAVVLFVLLIFNGLLESVLLVYLASLIINSIISFFVLVKSINSLPKTELLVTEKDYSIISILKTSKEFFITSIIIITMAWIDFILIDIFLDQKTAGVYSVALKLSTLISFGFTAFNAFLAPRISEIYFEGTPKKLQMLLSQNYVMIFPMLVVPFLGIVLLNEQLLGLFGSEFKSGWIILLLLAGGQFINSIFGPVSLLLQMTNFQKIFQNILIFTLIFKVICSLIFVKIWEAEGLAFANFLGLGLWTLIGSYFVYKKVGVYSWFGLKELKSIFFKI
ncbi:MAG: oligosaccharide flippase family protein [Flavobacteriaceae bacterium]